MDKQKLMPQAAQPVNRITTGQLPAELAELSEEVLQLHSDDSVSVLASVRCNDDLEVCVCGRVCTRCCACHCMCV